MAIISDPFISLLEQGFDPSGGGFAFQEAPLQLPGFSDTPLTVDVISTPIDTTFVTPTQSFGPLPLDLPLLFDQSKAGELERMQGFSDVPLQVNVESTPIDVSFPTATQQPPGEVNVDFTSVLGGGPVGFPTATQPDLLGLFSQGLGLVQSLVESPQQLPNTQVMQVNTQTAVCPPSRLGHRQHLTKPRKGVAQHCAPNRHMNSLNPRALRRAISRLKGFSNHVQSAQKAIRHALGHAVPHQRRSSSRSGCRTCGRPRSSCMC